MENLTTENTHTEQTASVDNAQAPARTYSQAEVDELLQKEGDRRVSDALKKAERKKAEAVKEAERLAKMNEDERYKEELRKREIAIQEKENALAVAENKAQASTILAERNISPALVELVVAGDADEMMAKINLLDKAFKDSVKAEVEKRLATNTPKKNLPLDKQMTKETFKSLPLSQQAEIFNNNPELYRTLTN